MNFKFGVYIGCNKYALLIDTPKIDVIIYLFSFFYVVGCDFEYLSMFAFNIILVDIFI